MAGPLWGFGQNRAPGQRKAQRTKPRNRSRLLGKASHVSTLQPSSPILVHDILNWVWTDEHLKNTTGPEGVGGLAEVAPGEAQTAQDGLQDGTR
eukprot:6787952-Pyramimonas_sp.AAC.2